MFGVMRPQNPTIDPALQRLFDVSFDDALRESVIGYLRREGMSRTRFGRTVLGDPRFVDKRLNGGGSVKLDTADRIRDFIGAMPFRPVFRWEVEAFLVLTGSKPWAVGYQSVCQPSFVDRLRAGASPYLSTVGGFADGCARKCDRRNATTFWPPSPRRSRVRPAPSRGFPRTSDCKESHR